MTNILVSLALVVCGAEAPNANAPGVHPHVWRLLDDTGEPVKVWVLFSNKGWHSAEDRLAAFARLHAEYDRQSLHRRQLRRTSPGLFDDRDLPVCETYVDAVRATGVRVHVVSTWLNAVSVTASATQVRHLAELPFVRFIQPVRRSVRADVVPIERVMPADPTGLRSFYGLADTQVTQSGLPGLHDAGYTGQSIIIGVLDTGFKRTHVAFNDATHGLTIVAEYDFVDDDANTAPETGDPINQHVHGTKVLGTIAAYAPDSLVAGAYDASFVLAKTEDATQEVQAEEDLYVAGLQFVEANGADVVTASLGYIDWYTQSDLDGLTATTTLAINTATDNGLVCVVPAGNDGHDSYPTVSHLLAPADAFQAITCGAVDSVGSSASFSSDGPTADGRVKPEVLALGVSAATVSSSSNTTYVTADGTSFSTPLVASAAALLVQAHPNWTVAQIRTALTQTASDYVAYGTYDAQYVRGYGVIDATAASDMNLGGGDREPDGDLDLFDFAGFQTCFSGDAVAHPAYPHCPAADFNGDGDVDHADYADFNEAMAAQ